MTPKHTPEPWIYDPAKCYSPGINGAKPVTGPSEGVFAADGRTTIAVFGPSNEPGNMADAARAVQCVNACAGIPDPAAELARLRAVEGAARAVRANYWGESSRGDLDTAIVKLCKAVETPATPDPRDARIAEWRGRLGS